MKNRHNNKLKKVFYCGLMFAGVTTVAYLAYNSKFRHSETKSDKDKTEILQPDSINVETEKQKLIGYSMTEAFRYGVINSIGEYVEKAPHKTDTVEISSSQQCFERGYYDEIDGQKTVVLNYVNPDTLSISDATPGIKSKIVAFANFCNGEVERNTTLAHEYKHQDTDPDENVGNNIHLDKQMTIPVFKYNMPSHKFILVCHHDELSGRFNGFLYRRELFKKYGRLSVFNGEYFFYARAVRRGDIKPFSTNPQDIANEQRFCMKSMCEQYAHNHKEKYQEYAINRLYAEHIPFDDKKRDEYPEALKVIHTYIWDGKIVDLSGYFLSGNLPEFQLTEEELAATEKKQERDTYLGKPQMPTVPIKANSR